MPDGVTFKIDGLEELQKKVLGLKEETNGKATNFGLLRAAQYLAKEAKQAAGRLDDPATGRSIESNIAVRKRSKRSNIRNRSFGYRVGVAGGGVTWKPGEKVDKSAGAKTPHWHLIELGTSKLPARPFMRPAMTRNLSTLTDIFVQNYSKKIDNILKKGGG